MFRGKSTGGENKVYISETYLQCRIKYLRVDEK